MQSADLAVLQRAGDWLRDGHRVTLFTVVETWGSAPRPVGSLLAVRTDGRVEGSVSGGCIEDDLLKRPPRTADAMSACELISYGVDTAEATRFGLPCGGTMRLVEEPLRDSGWIDELLARCARQERVRRRLDLVSGAVSLEPVSRETPLCFDGATLAVPFGPAWRLLLIGGGQLSRCVAELAQSLDFSVFICDPRTAYQSDWPNGVRRIDGMPDDAVLAIEPDARTAVAALTHDPRLDDMALLTALQSEAFYVGALGSRRNSEKRRERLLALGIAASAVARLHGPIGLFIGSRTPAEIALSIMAEVVATRNNLASGAPRPAIARALA